MAHWYPLLLHPSTTSATQTHAKQATVSTASHIQLQMSLLWAPALFDVMNNEDGFSFAQVSENCNTYCLGSSHQAVRSAVLTVYSCPSYIPTHTVQIHTLTDRFGSMCKHIREHPATEANKQWLSEDWYIKCLIM